MWACLLIFSVIQWSLFVVKLGKIWVFEWRSCQKTTGPGFFIRGGAQIKDYRTLAPVGWIEGVSEGDVTPKKWEKFNFGSQFTRFGALPKAPTKTQAPYLTISSKNREGAYPTPADGVFLVMLIYLSFPFLFPSTFSFHSFFLSLLFPFPFFFWRPFSDPGGPGPPKLPQNMPLVIYEDDMKVINVIDVS